MQCSIFDFSIPPHSLKKVVSQPESDCGLVQGGLSRAPYSLIWIVMIHLNNFFSFIGGVGGVNLVLCLQCLTPLESHSLSNFSEHQQMVLF